MFSLAKTGLIQQLRTRLKMMWAHWNIFFAAVALDLKLKSLTSVTKNCRSKLISKKWSRLWEKSSFCASSATTRANFRTLSSIWLSTVLLFRRRLLYLWSLTLRSMRLVTKLSLLRIPKTTWSVYWLTRSAINLGVRTRHWTWFGKALIFRNLPLKRMT